MAGLVRARADPVGALEEQGVRILDRDPVSGLLDQLDVVLAVPERDDALERDAEPLRHEGDPSSLRHGGVAELEQEGEGGRQEQAIAERRGERLTEGRDLGGFGDGDELRRRLREPPCEVSDLLDRNVLEVGVHPRVLGVLGHEQAVVDVTVRPVPKLGEQGDRLASGLEWDRLVEHERPAGGVDDRGSLVTDNEVGDARLLEIGPHRAEHPPRCDDHRDPSRLGACDRGAGAGAQQPVAADERAVEVAGECLDIAREGRGENQPPVACVTYAATSAIC